MRPQFAQSSCRAFWGKRLFGLPCSGGRAQSLPTDGRGQVRAVPVLAVLLAAALAAQGARAQQITIVDEHPRLVFCIDGTPDARTFQTIRDLYNSNGGNNPLHNAIGGWIGWTGDTNPVNEASRYVLTGDLAHAANALNAMSTGTLSYDLGSQEPTEYAETGIQWALAYDWIRNAWANSASPPADLQTKFANIEGKLASFVNNALADLDSAGPSLWHGRASAGAAAWVAALALPADNVTYDSLRSRAFADWQQSLKATHASGGWPEGPTYWATNRAINFPLAYQAYQTAVTAAPPLAVSDPLGDLRTLGLWQVYTQRGDGSFDRYGDVSSQAFISNGSIGRSIDYYAQVTGDPALAAFAESARAYRNPLYDSSYNWIYPVSYDPTIAKPAGYDPAHPAASLGSVLPHAMVFGKDAMGFAVMRQGWNSGDTEISFKAGDYLAHHGHYDQGTFTIFKNAPLVVNSGGYGDFFGDHRLNYYVRTVAVNSILIQRPDEVWTPAGVAPPGGYVNDGGQRIVKATGSQVLSYEDWQTNKTSGPNYELADITAFANVDNHYSYVASNLTRAYNSTLYDSEGQGGKVSGVTRQVMYIEDADVLVVFDRVTSTNPAYKKKWLLHTPNKFVGGSEVVARGSADNGIVEVDGASIAGNTMTMTNGGGKLFLQMLTPRQYTVNKVGGLDYRYYVEDDGNDADGYDGTNHNGGYTERAWNDYGNWRIEVSPKDPSTFDTFLGVLSPRASTVGSVDTATLLSDSPLATIMQVGSHIVGFGTHGQIGGDVKYRLPGGGSYNHLVVDLLPDQLYRVFSSTSLRDIQTNDAGLLAFDETATGPHDITLSLAPAPMTLWRLDQSSSASVSANWTAGLPNGAGHAAVFGNVITTERTVTIDAPATYGIMYFDSPHNYTIAGAGAITLQAAGLGVATVLVGQSGAGAGHTVSAPITLASPLEVIVASGAAITFAGPMTGPSAAGITKTGTGTLVLSGNNTYAGTTTVSAGTLLAENTTGSATGTGAVTVSAATLGGTGFINGPVTLTGDATLSSTGTLTINSTLTVKGLANQLSGGTVLTSGDVTIDPGAVFIINGTLGGNTGTLHVRGTLMGKGTIGKPLVIESGGVISPGAPSQIGMLSQILVSPEAPQNFSFEIGGPSPNYAVPKNSANDVIRLTNKVMPFASAAGDAPGRLTADTVIDVYFLFNDPPQGQYKAEFFAASDYTDAIDDATFQYWRLDPRGARLHNGNFFSPLDGSLVDWAVVPETAGFIDGDASGYITQFTVVPEPATLSLLALGGLLLTRWRSKARRIWA
jgi:autotransporter-associated beta strand protein